MISVIVPVYKVEKYLDQCVASIVSQSFSDLEIILVDDGSPDNCPAMCDNWAKRDSRIRVIHKENGGLSDARNAGVTAAKGSFIGFVDSDDITPPDMYQVLFSLMEQDDSDIAACGIKQFWDKNTPPHRMTSSGKYSFTTEEALHELILERHLKQPVWYKLYRRTTIINIPFPVGKYHEDVFWSYQAIGAARRVSVVDFPCYLYRQHPNSIMGSPYSLSHLDSLDALDAQVTYMQKHFPNLVPLAVSTFVGCCMYHFQKLCLYPRLDPDRQHRQWILDLMRKNTAVSSFKNMSAKERFRFTLFNRFPYLFCTCRNKLKRGI